VKHDGLTAADRMLALWGTPKPTPAGFEALRRQVALIPDYTGPVIAESANIPSLARIDAALIQVAGMMRLLQQYRQAFIAETEAPDVAR
jgi:hypothetical protein